MDFGESDLMLVGINVAAAQDPIRLQGLLIEHLALLELLDLLVAVMLEEVYLHLSHLGVVRGGADTLLA